MDENCIVKALDVFQRRQQKFDIVTVYGAYILESESLKQHAGCKQTLQ